VHFFCSSRENSEKHKGEGQKSLRRGTSVIGMAPDIDPSTWDHSELDKYGLGKGKGPDDPLQRCGFRLMMAPSLFLTFSVILVVLGLFSP
jgi:hypothetical protein